MKALNFKLCVIAAMLLGACNTNTTQKDDGKSEAIIKLAYENRDYNTAIAYTYNLYVTDVSKVYLLDSLFYLYSYAANYPSAAALATRLIDSRQSDKRFVFAAANAYEKNENYEQAAVGYERALALEIEDTLKVTYSLAKCYLELGEFNKSMQQAENVLKVKEASQMPLMIKDSKVTYQVGALNLIAMNYIKQKNFKEATEVLKTVIKIAPFFQPAKDNLQKLQLLMGVR